jgi:hypothetical protein
MQPPDPPARQVLFVSVFEQYLSHLRCVFRVPRDAASLPSGREAAFFSRAGRVLTRTRSSTAAGRGSSKSGAGAGGGAEAAAAAQVLVAAAGGGGAAAGAAKVEVDAAGTAGTLSDADAAARSHATGGASDAVAPSERLLRVEPPRPSSGGSSVSGRASGRSSPLPPLSAAKPPDTPLHVVSTDMAVTEVYGDGLTIIRAAAPTVGKDTPECKPDQARARLGTHPLERSRAKLGGVEQRAPAARCVRRLRRILGRRPT